MEKLTCDQLMTLEAYAKARNTFRDEVMTHKKQRKVHLGEHVTLLFEDRLTMQYQVQEMLRLERMFEQELIQEELDVYNPLIPDGSNWKATMMIEYPNVEERQRKLAEMTGIEDRVWVKVEGFEPVFAIADEDLDRSTEQKTSAVHFMRFELTPDMSHALKQEARLCMGVDHPAYRSTLDPVPAEIRASLLHDLQT